MSKAPRDVITADGRAHVQCWLLLLGGCIGYSKSHMCPMPPSSLHSSQSKEKRLLCAVPLRPKLTAMINIKKYQKKTIHMNQHIYS